MSVLMTLLHKHLKYYALYFIILILLCGSNTVEGGCRGDQESQPCESICNTDGICEIRVIVLLPNTTDIEPSLPRVRFFYKKIECRSLIYLS